MDVFLRDYIQAEAGYENKHLRRHRIVEGGKARAIRREARRIESLGSCGVGLRISLGLPSSSWGVGVLGADSGGFPRASLEQLGSRTSFGEGDLHLDIEAQLAGTWQPKPKRRKTKEGAVVEEPGRKTGLPLPEAKEGATFRKCGVSRLVPAHLRRRRSGAGRTVCGNVLSWARLCGNPFAYSTAAAAPVAMVELLRFPCGGGSGRHGRLGGVRPWWRAGGQAARPDRAARPAVWVACGVEKLAGFYGQ